MCARVTGYKVASNSPNKREMTVVILVLLQRLLLLLDDGRRLGRSRRSHYGVDWVTRSAECEKHWTDVDLLGQPLRLVKVL